MRSPRLIVILLYGLLAQASPAQTPASVTAFVDVSVIPMDSERVLDHQTVVVRGDRIVALGPAPQVPVPSGAQQIDGRGKYLLPGLADLHVHGGFGGKFDSLRLIRDLAEGVTTIRDMHSGGSKSRALEVKRAVASGALLGPRVYTAGDFDERYGGEHPATIADSIRALKEGGHDFIKLYAFPKPVYDSVVAAARRVGLRVAGHVPSETGKPDVDVELARVLQDGWASIEHLSGYLAAMTGTPDMIGAVMAPAWAIKMRDTAAWSQPGYQWDMGKIRALAVATQKAGVWNSPTMTASHLYTTLNGDETDITKWKRPTTGARWLVMLLDLRAKLVKALQEAGAGLLLGTDGLGKPSDELRLFVDDAGLTPYQALATGTRNAAVFLGTLDSTGTVAVGKRADLLLLDGNPLQDIRAVASRTGVMVGGRWLPRAELDAQVEATRRAPRRP